MITAKFTADKESLYIRMTVKGHAGQAEHGHDIVCASASILTYTVAQIVRAMDKHGDLKGKPVIDLEEGDAMISCRCRNPEDFGELVHTFFVAEVGYLLLAENYPQYVKVKSVWEGEKP